MATRIVSRISAVLRRGTRKVRLECLSPEDAIDRVVDIGHHEVEVDTILARFGVGHTLQDQPGRAFEGANGYKRPVGSGWAGLLAEQLPKKRLSIRC